MYDGILAVLLLVIFFTIIFCLYRLYKKIIDTDEHGFLGCLGFVLIVILSGYLSNSLITKIDDKVMDYKKPTEYLESLVIVDSENNQIITMGEKSRVIVYSQIYNWIKDSYKKTEFTGPLTWGTENDEIIKINQDGEIIGLKNGITRIFATYKDQTIYSNEIYVESSNSNIYNKIQKGIYIDDSLLVPHKLNGHYGYVDINGKTIIPHKYDSVEEFEDGKARVKISRILNSKSKYYFDSGPVWLNNVVTNEYIINQQGEIIREKN